MSVGRGAAPKSKGAPGGPRRYAEVSENHVIANAQLLQATTELIKALKERLSYCFKVSMIDDVYVDWETKALTKWEAGDVLKSWEIRNVAEHEKQEALKLLGEFEKTYGCSLASFIEAAFATVQKGHTGHAPLAHTKIQRTARRFKALGHPKLTPSIVRRSTQCR